MEQAIINNDLEYIKKNTHLLKSRLKCNYTPLHLAVSCNKKEIAIFLIQSGINVNAKANDDHTPLHVAAMSGSVEMVPILLEHGADPTCLTKEFYSALRVACCYNNIEIAKLLIPYKVRDLGLALVHSVLMNKYDVVKFLLENNADVNSEFEIITAPASCKNKHDRKNQTSTKINALSAAVSNGNIEIVKLLLDHNAVKNNDAIRLATKFGHTAIMLLLMDTNFQISNLKKLI
jgi:ankyrin repeat protein